MITPPNTPPDYLDLLVKVGSLLGAIAFFYTLRLNTRNAPRFKFDSWSFSGINQETDSENRIHFNCTFDGFITNMSTESNYIKGINLVVWKNSKKRDATLRYGSNPSSILNKATGVGVNLSLPLEFKAKEGKRVEISFREQATGTADENIIREVRPRGYVLPANFLLRWFFYLKMDKSHRSGYELVFEDTKGNYFDQYGALIDIRLTHLYWTLSNYKSWKKCREHVKIFYRKINLIIKKIAFKMGLY